MNKKYLSYAGLAIICVIILVLLGGRRLTPATRDQQEPAQTEQVSDTQQPASSTKTTKTLTTKLGYGEALKFYAFKIQFTRCSGNPGTLIIKKGNSLMLDNRDNIAHTFKIGKRSLKINAYDYAVFIPTAVDVGFSQILCDGGGAASLTVEP